jgi:hypothetical protein
MDQGTCSPRGVPAADLGGVGGPVSGGGFLPGDGDGDVDAEHVGEDGGGQVGGELEQGGGAGLTGADADLAQALAELVGAIEGPAPGSLLMDRALSVGRVP